MLRFKEGMQFAHLVYWSVVSNFYFMGWTEPKEKEAVLLTGLIPNIL